MVAEEGRSGGGQGFPAVSLNKNPATSIAKIEPKEISSYQLVVFTWPPENLVTALLK